VGNKERSYVRALRLSAQATKKWVRLPVYAGLSPDTFVTTTCGANYTFFERNVLKK
jgi:hypothetical protein